MKIPEGLSCPVTPDMAYANGVPEIPKDWEFVSFGRVMPGRAWLSSPEGHPVEPGPGTTLPVGPRIIVRRKPEPKPKPPEFTEEEIDTCQRAGVLAGILPNHMMPGANDMSFIVGRLRKLDQDLLRYYGSKPDTSKAVEPKPKPASCPGNAGIVPTPHCPCTDKCCFCHYEEQLPSKQTRARRWLVEIHNAPQGDFSPGPLRNATNIEILAEVKPITREQIEEATEKANFYPAPINTRGMQKAELFLMALGIEVED